MTNQSRRLGTFEGVFTPTILTILGVIMYLRLGWVVGNAGFGGALVIILLSKVVTITTGLALSSMTTNIKIGAGGSYALISRSLGAEIGSAIGIPLYLSQALGGALYISGFTEGWLSIFPSHNPIIVSTIALAGLFAVSYIGAKEAMRVHYFIMALIVLSLVSFFLGLGEGSKEIVIWGEFPKAGFWAVFAIFFPAVTGIEAGAAMSGDLKNPGRNLPIGILSAVFVSLIIYIGMAFLFDYFSSPEELVNNYTVITDIAKWKIFMLAGILGATLSSALGSIVGGPRTLMALGQDKVLPFSRLFAWKSKNGEPRISLVFTVVLIEICLILADLNTIAPLLTMFFLITYGFVNFIVLIEKGIAIPSFRPSFKIPTFIPLIGTIWCFVIMFLINAVFAVIAIIFILGVYIIQVKRGIKAPWGDVRSGLFSAIAEWAARTSAKLPYHAKSWKPNLMVPIENPKNWSYLINFIKDIVAPSGTLRVFSAQILKEGSYHGITKLDDILYKKDKTIKEIREAEPVRELENQLKALVAPVDKEGIFTAAMVVECHDFIEGLNIVTQVMTGMFFPPNTVFLTMSDDPSKDRSMEEMVAITMREELGLLVLAMHPKAAFGTNEKINVWLRTGSPNLNLSILIALQLERNWNCKIRLVTVAANEDELIKTERFLSRTALKARMPADTETEVLVGDFKDVLQKSPPADLNIFGMARELDIKLMHEIYRLSDSSCLFVRDSGAESALA